MSSQPLSVVPRLSTFSVCDDVRAEQGGKLTIVGFYGKSIRVPAIPVTMPKLCFFAQFEPPSWRPGNMRVRLVSPSGSLMLETPNINVPTPEEASVIPVEYRQANVVFQFAPMTFNEEGVHFVEYEFSGLPPYRLQFFVGADPALAASLVSLVPPPRAENV